MAFGDTMKLWARAGVISKAPIRKLWPWDDVPSLIFGAMIVATIFFFLGYYMGG
jgi:hypothetical protein